MAYNIRVASSTAGTPQYWSQQVVSATQKNIYYNFGNAGIGIPLPKATLHLVNNCCIGSAFATSNVPTDSLIVSSNVGIGTALPQANLHVQGNAIISGNLTVQGSNIVNNQIVNNIEYNSSNVVINNISGLGPALKVSQTGSGLNYPIADFYDNDVSTTIPALRIADGGNVGIGTTLPQTALDVNGSINCSGFFMGNTNFCSYSKIQIGAAVQGYENALSTGALVFNNTIKENSIVTKNNTNNTTFTFNYTGYYMMYASLSIQRYTSGVPNHFDARWNQSSGNISDQTPWAAHYCPDYSAGRHTVISNLKVSTAGSTAVFTIQPNANSSTAVKEYTYSTYPFHTLQIIYLGPAL